MLSITRSQKLSTLHSCSPTIQNHSIKRKPKRTTSKSIRFYKTNFFTFKEQKDETLKQQRRERKINVEGKTAIADEINNGMRFYENGRFYDALESFDICQKAKPENNFIRFYRTLCYNGLGQVEKAKTLLEEIIESDDKFIEAFVNLGIIEYELGNLEVAVKHWKAALKIEPKEKNAVWKENVAIAYRNLGLIHKDRKENEKAKAYLSKSYKIFPEPSTLISLGDVFADMLNFEKAETCFVEALKGSPTAAGYYSYGCLHIFHDWEGRDLKKGIQYINKSIEILPEKQRYPEAYYSAAWGHFLGSDLDIGISMAEKGLAIDNNAESKADILAICGDSSLQADRYPEALKYYQSVLEIAPERKDDTKIMGNIGIILYHMDNKKEAVQYLAKAYQAEPRPEYLRLLARYAVDKGEYEKALKIVEKWEILDHKVVEPLFLRAKIWYDSGRNRQEVFNLLEKIIQSVQDSEEKEKDMFMHGWAYDCMKLTWTCAFELNDKATGISLMNQGLALNPTDFTVMRELCKHLVHEKISIPKAIRYLTTIIHKADFLANYDLGIAYIYQKKFRVAITHFERLVKSKKTHPELVLKSLHFITSLYQLLGEDIQYKLHSQQFKEYQKNHRDAVVEYHSVDQMLNQYDSKETGLEELDEQLDDIDLDVEAIRNEGIDPKKHGINSAEKHEVLMNYGVQKEDDFSLNKYITAMPTDIDYENPKHEDIAKMKAYQKQVQLESNEFDIHFRNNYESGENSGYEKLINQEADIFEIKAREIMDTLTTMEEENNGGGFSGNTKKSRSSFKHVINKKIK